MQQQQQRTDRKYEEKSCTYNKNHNESDILRLRLQADKSMRFSGHQNNIIPTTQKLNRSDILKFVKKKAIDNGLNHLVPKI